MSGAAGATNDGRPRFAVSLQTGEPGGSPLVVKRALDPSAAGLLGHEREVLAGLSHPNIIEVARRDEGQQCVDLVTYLAGRTTLADRPPSDPLTAIRTAVQLATTLAELHDLGWAHGAVRAEHCIVSPGGSIVLCSFRRAMRVSGPEAPAAVGDVVALVELLTSFADANPRRRTPEAAMATVLATAANHTPSARHLAGQLAGLLGDRATSAVGRRDRPPSRERRRPRHRRRSPAPAVAVRLVACLTAGIAIWLLRPSASRGVGSADDLAAPLRTLIQVARIIGLAAAAYGVVVTGLTLAALLTKSSRLAHAAERIGPSPLRRWVTGLTSLGLLGAGLGAIASGAPRAAAVEAPPARSPRPRAGPSTTGAAPTTTSTTTTTTTTSTPSTSDEPSPATSAIATSDRDGSDAASDAVVTAQPAVAPTIPAPPAAPLTTWHTAPGDDLWHIARSVLEASGHASASNAEVGHYWQALIAANRDRVSDPDLIYPGQLIDLPPVDEPDPG